MRLGGHSEKSNPEETISVSVCNICVCGTLVARVRVEKSPCREQRERQRDINEEIESKRERERKIVQV